METQQLRNIAYDVFSTLNDLNPNFMDRTIPSFSKYSLQKDNLYVHSQNTVTLGNKSL